MSVSTVYEAWKADLIDANGMGRRHAESANLQDDLQPHIFHGVLSYFPGVYLTISHISVFGRFARTCLWKKKHIVA